jgi:spermidine/putrescine transport system substrate-binding protein
VPPHAIGEDVPSRVPGTGRRRRARRRRHGTAAGRLRQRGGSRQKAAEQKTPTAVSHPKTEIGDWTWSNWPYYIDKSILKGFDRTYGGHVKYLEDVNDNFQFFAKMRPMLAAGRDPGRDLMVATSYIAARFARNGWLEPLDKRNIPNAANLRSHLEEDFDAGRKLTLPYLIGAVGLVYNRKLVGGDVTSVNDVLDPRFKGKVTIPSDPYESACSVLLGDGVDSTHASIDQLLGAVEKIDKAQQAGQFRRFASADLATDMAKGNVWVALGYSGDAIQYQSDNPDVRFAYPEEGAMIFVDELMIPKGAESPYAAETMMDYLYDPEVAARLATATSYQSPVEGAREVVARKNPKLAEDPLMFPPEDVAAKLHSYPTLTPSEEQRFLEAMAKVTGA